MNVLIDTLFERWTHEDGSRPFLICPQGDDHIIITRDAFQAQINQLGHALRAVGVKTGDRVAVQVEKSPQAFALYFAVVKIGAVFLPLNTGYTITELTYFIDDAEPSVVVTDASTTQPLRDAAGRKDITFLTMNADGMGSLMENAQSQPDQLDSTPRGDDDLAAILYTSGTTGRSKGAMLSHKNLLSNAEVLVNTWAFTDRDTLLHALPIYHTHGLFVAGNIMTRAGGVIIYLPKFDAETMIRMMPQATSMMGVPTFYTRLLADSRLDRSLTQKMRLFISGSAPLLAETHLEFEARTSHRILERYGMTETNMNTSNPYDGDRRAGTVGFPLPGIDIRVVDEKSGQVLPTGEIGVIEVKGDNVTSGYWRNEEKTAQSFRPDGYFITGDLGIEDHDGYVTIVGRDKDLIISGGLNIYPKEIEDAINAIDGITESAVIGIPHPDFGEGVVAVIVGANVGEGSAQNVTAETIMDKLSQQLAKFKQPKSIQFAQALPRNTMGKVQKAEMRKTYAGLFQD